MISRVVSSGKTIVYFGPLLDTHNQSTTRRSCLGAA